MGCQVGCQGCTTALFPQNCHSAFIQSQVKRCCGYYSFVSPFSVWCLDLFHGSKSDRHFVWTTNEFFSENLCVTHANYTGRYDILWSNDHTSYIVSYIVVFVYLIHVTMPLFYNGIISHQCSSPFLPMNLAIVTTAAVTIEISFLPCWLPHREQLAEVVQSCP